MKTYAFNQRHSFASDRWYFILAHVCAVAYDFAISRAIQINDCHSVRMRKVKQIVCVICIDWNQLHGILAMPFHLPTAHLLPHFSLSQSNRLSKYSVSMITLNWLYCYCSFCCRFCQFACAHQRKFTRFIEHSDLTNLAQHLPSDYLLQLSD